LKSLLLKFTVVGICFSTQFLSITVSITSYIPESEYICLGFCSLEVFPSPKSHLYIYSQVFPVIILVKSIVSSPVYSLLIDAINTSSFIPDIDIFLLTFVEFQHKSLMYKSTLYFQGFEKTILSKYFPVCIISVFFDKLLITHLYDSSSQNHNKQVVSN
jgi:hypothetical protein